jgi:hypothetical protein
MTRERSSVDNLFTAPPIALPLPQQSLEACGFDFSICQGWAILSKLCQRDHQRFPASHGSTVRENYNDPKSEEYSLVVAAADSSKTSRLLSSRRGRIAKAG